MSDADALLDAIFDHPDDDTPRLVYADWLQENGQENYAEFIRISVLIARRVLPAAERDRLRKRRFILGRELVQSYPLAAQVINEHPRNGLPRERIRIDVSALTMNWATVWPFVRPRQLAIRDLPGHEAELRWCEYLRRVVSLACEGRALSGWGTGLDDADWIPVSGEALTALAARDDLRKLVSLKVEPVRPSAAELVTFAGSTLARRLQEMSLWVEFSDGSHDYLRASAGRAPGETDQFVRRHRDRLIVSPACAPGVQ